jgi:hypothetical protein
MSKGDNHLSLNFKQHMKSKEPNSPVISMSALLEHEAAIMKNEGSSQQEKR